MKTLLLSFKMITIFAAMFFLITGCAKKIPPETDKSVEFCNLIIKEFVCEQLGKEDNQITAEDLMSIKLFRYYGEYDEDNNPCLFDVQDLRMMPNLENIEIQTVKFENIEALNSLTKLTGIWFRYCQFVRLPLLEAANLESVTVRDNSELTDISGLSGAVNLRWLQISDCTALSDISVLEKMTQLEHLSLRHTAANDISFVQNMRKLETLDLYKSTEIKDLSPVLVLTQLKELRIMNTGAAHLYLTKDPQTIAQYEAIKEALPECKIQFGIVPVVDFAEEDWENHVVEYHKKNN